MDKAGGYNRQIRWDHNNHSGDDARLLLRVISLSYRDSTHTDESPYSGADGLQHSGLQPHGGKS